MEVLPVTGGVPRQAAVLPHDPYRSHTGRIRDQVWTAEFRGTRLREVAYESGMVTP
jgi:hypothetical protein